MTRCIYVEHRLLVLDTASGTGCYTMLSLIVSMRIFRRCTDPFLQMRRTILSIVTEYATYWNVYVFTVFHPWVEF